MTADRTAGSVRSFRIEVADAVLDDLRERLRRTRFPGEVAGSGWTYGTNLAYLRELVQYWLERYDWRAAEAALNELPQFLATVDGQELHFVHVRGKGTAPLPLLISHGWPGSFVEMTDVIHVFSAMISLCQVTAPKVPYFKHLSRQPIHNRALCTINAGWCAPATPTGRVNLPTLAVGLPQSTWRHRCQRR